MIVAIHQPNFFAWLGFFQKIVRSDVFVLLDHVQLPRKGGSWINRVKLLVSGVPQWMTAPVQRPANRPQSIMHARFDERAPWREKLLKTLDANYRQAPHFREAIDLLEPLILCRATGPAEYNMLAIEGIRTALGFGRTRLVRSSSLSPRSDASELLVELCRQVGATTYLCGDGASEYQDDTVFARAGLAVAYQRFQHPRYPQIGAPAEFVPGLSVIDALMNCGCRATARMLTSG
jgi:hypothetical protein